MGDPSSTNQQLCIGCETAPVREHWLTVYPDGTEESMLTEAIAGRSLYCQSCYDRERS